MSKNEFVLQMQNINKSFPGVKALNGACLDLHYGEVHALDYPLTPHVTLAYYRPGCIEGDRLARLRRAIREANGQWKPELELYTMALAYQEFADMNTYRAID